MENIGVYKLQHSSGIFYIGSTSNLKLRWTTHKSLFLHGRNSKLLQKVFNKSKNINEWTMDVLEYCTRKQLKQCEDKHLAQHYSNPLCMNIKRTGGNIGRRGLKMNHKAMDNQAVALLGKNTKDGKVHRKKAVTFISPDGIRYTNVISVKRFSEEHGLPQPAMNTLANGMTCSVKGWTLEDGSLPHVSDVIHYWPTKRIEQNYTAETVIGPDGKHYKVYSRLQFEAEHNCRIVIKSTKAGCSKKYKGLDKFGRGYRLAHIPVFTFTYEGTIYDNVVSISKLCQTLGLTFECIRQSMLRPQLYKRKYSVHLKYTEFPTN